jgi:hypothetical protein
MSLFRPNVKFPEPLSIGQHLGLWHWWAGQTTFVVLLLGGIVVALVAFNSDRPTWLPTGIDQTAETAWFRLTYTLIYFWVLAIASWIGGRVSLFLFTSK